MKRATNAKTTQATHFQLSMEQHVGRFCAAAFDTADAAQYTGRHPSSDRAITVCWSSRFLALGDCFRRIWRTSSPACWYHNRSEKEEEKVLIYIDLRI